MSTDEMNRAVAEAVGLVWSMPDECYFKNGSFACKTLPRFTADFNACAEMRKSMTRAQQNQFAYNLRQELGFHSHSYFDLVDAAAIQQCRAFLKTVAPK